MSAFTDAIQRNWPDYTIAPGASRRNCCIPSHELDDNDTLEDISDETLQLYDEGNFSWSECDSCDQLGGSRYPAHAIKRASFGHPEQPGDIYHIEICTDCVLFHANGDEPKTA